MLRYPSGHRDNVFQARILPASSNQTVVSCAADGQVRHTGLHCMTESCMSLLLQSSSTLNLGCQPERHELPFPL